MTERKTPLKNTRRLLTFQWFNEAFCLVSNSVLVDSLRLRNRQLIVKAKLFQTINKSLNFIHLITRYFKNHPHFYLKNRISFILLIFWLSLPYSYASYKVYLIHGYGGVGLELGKIYKSIQKEGYNCEIFYYPSLAKDIDSVGKVLFNKIQQESFDSVSFVTHSMGALVVRTLYEHLSPEIPFPYIHRIVMIAPPNKGTPVADFYRQFEFTKFLAGPNINNLTTDSLSGAIKYPLPTCEVGLIIGNINKKKCYTVPLNGENDGVVPAESSKMGIEKDIVFVKATHIQLLFVRRVSTYVLNFLNRGKFE